MVNEPFVTPAEHLLLYNRPHFGSHQERLAHCMTPTVAVLCIFFLLVMLFARGLHRSPFAIPRIRKTRIPYGFYAPLTGGALMPLSRLLCTLPTPSHRHANLPGIAPSLIQFLRESLGRSLAERRAGEGDASDLAELKSGGNQMADRIFDRLISDPEYTLSNKELAYAGDGLYRALRVVPTETIEGLCDGSVTIPSVLTKYKQHIAQNRAVFDIITKHHRSIITEDWNEVTEGKEALAKYSSAAATMGKKRWVVESNMWMESFALSYFRHGGARKHYLDKNYNIREAQFPSWEEKKEFVGRFDKDLMAPAGPSPTADNANGANYEYANARKIRLLDVGSCYNPIEKSDQTGVFDVTALDLFPADPTVFQCDFLNLTVGPAGSDPIRTTAGVTETMFDHDGAVGASSAGTLTQLPAGSFDAVTMSLVLSYLPTPEQRAAMIRKARQLLVSPDPHGPPNRRHQTGLLLIAEKPSIFNSKKEHTADNVGKNKSFLLTSWKQAIANEGFELVKYRMMWANGRCSHLFAFATTDAPVVTERGSEPLSSEAPRMWIKQDFDPLYGQDEMDDAENSTASAAEEVVESLRTGFVRRPIGIVGGGIGGCALALSLQQKKIPYVVFEKDAGFDVRKQGYALTMQQGGPALRALGLGDLLGQHGAVSTNHTSYRWDGTRLGTYGLSKRKPCESNSTQPAAPSELAVAQQTVQPLETPPGEGLLKAKTRHNVHIPRQKLREIMLQSINPDNILWNKKLSTVEVHSGVDASSEETKDAFGKGERYVRLKFEDGTEQEVSALIGADGIYSSVRKALTSVAGGEQLTLGASRREDLKYLGLMVILGIASNPTPEETAAAGVAPFARTQRQWLDGQTRVFSMPYDKNHTMWQLSYPSSEAEAIALSTSALHESESSGATKSDALKEEALRRCAGWAPDLVALLSRSERGLVSGHPVYDRDPSTLNIIRSLEEAAAAAECEESSAIPEKPSNWPITLLGDAAHPMSPFKGQGANQAILDALALSRAISSSNLFVPARAKTANSAASGHRRSIAENLRLYEQDMYAKAAEKVQRSRDAAFYLHNESALAEGNVTRAKAAEDFALSLHSADN